MKVPVNANGNIPVTEDGVTTESTLTMHAPAVIGGTIAIGYLDATGAFIPYTDGGLTAGESKVFHTGVGVQVVANITGFTASFIIQSGLSRSR